jgi:hypothetical protein
MYLQPAASASAGEKPKEASAAGSRRFADGSRAAAVDAAAAVAAAAAVLADELLLDVDA